MQRAALDVVELEADGLAPVGAPRASPSVVVLGLLGRIRIRRREIRELREPGLVDRSTPSRITGPLPALISSVKIVSITSSLSARPPHV